PDKWHALTMRPGRDPVGALEAMAARLPTSGLYRDPPELTGGVVERLARAAELSGMTVVVIVDQAEELVTACDAAARQAFAATIADIARGGHARLKLIVALRDDHLSA